MYKWKNSSQSKLQEEQPQAWRLTPSTINRVVCAGNDFCRPGLISHFCFGHIGKRPKSDWFKTWLWPQPLSTALKGITLISCYLGIYKCASVSVSMQGRLFIVLLGKNHFIKVYVYICECAVSTKHMLSQQKQELGDPANEPEYYSSIKTLNRYRA